MKKKWLLICALPIAMGAVVFETRSAFFRGLAARYIGNGPRIDCPATLELGDREQGRLAIARFQIKNGGGQPLTLSNFGSNCACSGVEREVNGQWTRLAHLSIPPGEKVDVAVRVFVTGTAGTQAENTVAFDTNDTSRSRMIIAVRIARIRGGVRAVPESLVQGSLSLGTKVERNVEIWDDQTPARTIKSVISRNPELVAVEFVPASLSVEQVAHGLSMRLGTIRLSILCATAGDIVTAIEVHLSDGRPADVIPVIAHVTAPIELSPQEIVLPRNSSGKKSFQMDCVCRSPDRNPFKLEIEDAPADIHVEFQAIDRTPHMHRIRVEWKPERSKNVSAGEIRQVVHMRALFKNDEFRFSIPVLCTTD